MNRFAASFAAAIFCLTASMSAFALTSVCGKSDILRLASHTVNLNWYESTIINSLEWKSALAGAKNLTLSDKYANASIVALHLFYTLPYGSYTLTGTAKLNTVELGKWEQLSGSKCQIVFEFPEPDFCDNTDLKLGTTTSLTGEFSGKIDGIFNVALDSRIGSCSFAGSPNFSGDLRLMSVSQCCEKQKVNKSGEALQGSVTVKVLGVACSTKSVRVPVGILSAIKFTFGANLGGSASATGTGSPALCNSSGSSASISGSVSRTLGVSVSAAFLDDRLVSATGSASTTLTASFSASTVSAIETSGCTSGVTVKAVVSMGGDEGLSKEFSVDVPNTGFCF